MSCSSEKFPKFFHVFSSVTELEIDEGFAGDSNEAYFYFREITDLKQHIAEPAANKFVDLDEGGLIDTEAQVGVICC